jgi:hypothetical protein
MGARHPGEDQAPHGAARRLDVYRLLRGRDGGGLGALRGQPARAPRRARGDARSRGHGDDRPLRGVGADAARLRRDRRRTAREVRARVHGRRKRRRDRGCARGRGRSRRCGSRLRCARGRGDRGREGRWRLREDEGSQDEKQPSQDAGPSRRSRCRARLACERLGRARRPCPSSRRLPLPEVRRRTLAPEVRRAAPRRPPDRWAPDDDRRRADRVQARPIQLRVVAGRGWRRRSDPPAPHGAFEEGGDRAPLYGARDRDAGRSGGDDPSRVARQGGGPRLPQWPQEQRPRGDRWTCFDRCA